MIDFKKELDCCYRVDRHIVGTKRNVKPQIFEEYFLRGGENCILQFPNLESPFCYVHLYEDVIPFDVPLELDESDEMDEIYYPKLMKAINQFREIMMVYDYCMGKLRKIENMEDRKTSPLFNVKYCLEAAINSGNLDVDFEELGISDKLIDKLNKRCEYLAYAGALEWKGVIKTSTMNKFHTIDALKKYVQEKGLLEKGEGRVGSKVIGFVGRADEHAPDPLCDGREVENALEHFQTSRKLKSKKTLKLMDELDKENEIVYVFACYAQEVSQKMNEVDSDSAQYKTLRDEYKKSIEICQENGARISLIAPYDGYDYEK